jgi:hypothetical protein
MQYTRCLGSGMIFYPTESLAKLKKMTSFNYF